MVTRTMREVFTKTTEWTWIDAEETHNDLKGGEQLWSMPGGHRVQTPYDKMHLKTLPAGTLLLQQGGPFFPL